MGKEHNISEANCQLGDTTYYKRLDQDPTSDHQRLLNEKLTEMLASKAISEDNIEYLTVANPRTGRFYLLPKTHKPGNPGRPIVSANGHPTKRISEFVDLHYLCLITIVCPRYHLSYKAISKRHTRRDIACLTWWCVLIHQHTTWRRHRGMQWGVEHQRNYEPPDQIISGPSNPCVEMQHLWIQWKPLPSTKMYSHRYKNGSIIFQHFHGFLEKSSSC